MKTSRYTEAQIIAILRQGESGVPVAELYREHCMSNASFYKWRAGGRTGHRHESLPLRRALRLRYL
jgi:Transposase.